MKEKTKRIYAVILCLVMIFTSIGTDFTVTKAEDFSRYFTFISYQKDNTTEKAKYDEAKSKTVGQYEATIDGISYVNYALISSKGMNATATAGNVPCNTIIDGASGEPAYQLSTADDVQSMMIDLNRIRSIDLLQLAWPSDSAKTYAIEFSLDGKNWTTVAYLDNCTKTGSRVDQINLVKAQNTRYIKLQLLKRLTANKYKIYEISAFSASGRADGVNPISAYTYTSEQQAAIDASNKELETEIPTTEAPTGDSGETLRPVTDPAFVSTGSTVTNINYNYTYDQAGFAAGTITLTTTEDQRYSLYWGTGDDIQGYKALTRNDVPYTALGKVTTSSNRGTFTVISDYTAIPEGATKLLVLDEENDIQYVYNIPANRVFVGKNYRYTFASIGDQHYNRYKASGQDDALYAVDNALKFIDNQGIKFVAGVGDLSDLAEKSAFLKYRNAINDYPNLTVLTCIGNHDVVNSGPDYFKQYMNEDIYKYKNEDSDTLESRGIMSIGSNEMDFVYSPEGIDDVFIFLNMNSGGTNSYTNMNNILYDTQLDWLDEQLAKYTDRNVYLYFHVYLSTDSLNATQCVGNLKSPGGVYYDLTYATSAKDGERLRSIINKYSNVTMFSGHSHWLYSMQMFNKNLNIGTTSTVSFAKGATIVHVSSVTEPRYVGMEDKARTGMNNKASEGTITDVYSDCKVYTGVDFWNGEYEAYATYMDPKSLVAPPKETDTTSKNLGPLGYQLSTDITGIAAKAPAFRMISKCAKVVKNQDVVTYGTIYAPVSEVPEGEKAEDFLVYDNEALPEASKVKANVGIIRDWDKADDKNTYYVLTVKTSRTPSDMAKYCSKKYYVRSFCILADGTYIYSQKIQTISIYAIANNLYNNYKTNSTDLHNYLYDNIISKVNPLATKIDFVWNNSIYLLN